MRASALDLHEDDLEQVARQERTVGRSVITADGDEVHNPARFGAPWPCEGDELPAFHALAAGAFAIRRDPDRHPCHRGRPTRRKGSLG
jgi:hypothetical protein